MATILIVYDYDRHNVRNTIVDHLFSFKRYSRHRCIYVDVRKKEIHPWIRKIQWDLVVFHTTFLSSRWTRELFLKNSEKVNFLKHHNAVKIALPQDEFINMDLVCNFINDFGINHVFSVSPESEWPKIYKTIDLHKVEFHNVLTGYLEDSTIARVKKIAGTISERKVDIGYRAYHAAYWLGRHGSLKWQIGDVFAEKALAHNLVTDISTDAKDTLFGDDWYRFLLSCKYQIGVEGGASILDWDGTYRKNTEEYLLSHPKATFDEVERKCFPGVDGELHFAMLSPRQFECCMTRTCQVLVEGEYSGVLIPGKHYVEVKRDFSNIGEVLEIIKKDNLRAEITENAWNDIVASGEYSYRNFVNSIINTAIGQIRPQKPSMFRRMHDMRALVVFYMTWLDYQIWIPFNERLNQFGDMLVSLIGATGIPRNPRVLLVRKYIRNHFNVKVG